MMVRGPPRGNSPGRTPCLTPARSSTGGRTRTELLNALAAEPLNTGRRARIQSLISGTQPGGAETVG